MRIGIDGRYIHDHFPGIGRYTYNLITALAEIAESHTIVVIHNPRLPNTRFDVAALGRLSCVELVATDVPTLSLAEQRALPPLARRLGLHVWHAPYYVGPYRLPCPLVVTIHDAISSHYPQYLPSLKARLSYQATMRLAVTRARRVIADSLVSQADLGRFFGVSPARISVIYSAADERFRPQPPQVVASLRARLNLPADYVLYLGTNKPHKNLARLVEAWVYVDARSSAPLHRRSQLVIAGKEDARYPQAREAAARLGVQTSVRFLGDVAEADLPALYSGALLFAFPSLYEGFGLPVLEAMACGVPVVCSTAPSLLEIVGNAAMTVDPLDVDGLAVSISYLLSDVAQRAELSRRGLKQAVRFSWRSTAQETMAVYQAVI